MGFNLLLGLRTKIANLTLAFADSSPETQANKSELHEAYS
jgi:hypothetical protein